MTSWSGWASLAGQLSGGTPVAARNGDGRLEVFALATAADGPHLVHLWQVSPGADWSEWDDLGAPAGEFLGALAAGPNSDQRLEVFGRVGLMSAGVLAHIWQEPAGLGWSTWDDLGGN